MHHWDVGLCEPAQKSYQLSHTKITLYSPRVSSRHMPARLQAAKLRGSGTKSCAILEVRALLYMIIEHFKSQDPVPVYRRFRDRGRLAPEGLRYVSSWVDEKLESCFQLMEAEDRKHLDEWIVNWNDLVEFEVFPVISSNEAAERISPRL
jgi:hypothetical protein